MIEIKSPRFEEIDLGTFDDEYAGMKVRVAVNPSRAFRAEYRRACANAVLGTDDKDFAACLSVVLGLPTEEAVAQVNTLPPDAAQWMFFYTIDDYNAEAGRFETTIRPHLLQVWDDWVSQRVKAHAARPPASVLAALASPAATSPTTSENVSASG